MRKYGYSQTMSLNAFHQNTAVSELFFEWIIIHATLFSSIHTCSMRLCISTPYHNSHHILTITMVVAPKVRMSSSQTSYIASHIQSLISQGGISSPLFLKSGLSTGITSNHLYLHQLAYNSNMEKKRVQAGQVCQPPHQISTTGSPFLLNTFADYKY